MKDQRTIQELRSTVAGRDMVIDEKNLQIAELRSDIVDLKRDVVHRDKQISRLESTYDSMYSAMLEDNQAIMKDLKGCQRCGYIGTRIVIVLKDTPSIDELNETISDLRMASGDMLDQLSDRARKAELCKKEINRLRRILGTADNEINELSSRYCDRCDQLEKIERLVDTQDHRQKYVLLGRIKDIIMEK